MKQKFLPAQAIVYLVILFGMPGSLVAEMAPGQIRAIAVQGEVLQRTSPAGSPSPLKKDAIVSQGAIIETGRDGDASLLFANGSVITIGPESRFSVEKFLTDPFDAENVDYRNLRQEPARSETRLQQDKGTLVFSVRKQQRGSSYDIVTPVGTAGIRGTLGVIWLDDDSTPENPTTGIGVDNGRVQVTTPQGQTQNLGPGDATGLGGPADSIQFTPAPPNTRQMLQMARETGNEQQQQIPQSPFNSSAETVPAGESSTTEMSPENLSALEGAAAEGTQALVDAVLKLVAGASVEEAAAIIAFAVANLGMDSAMVPQLADPGTKVLQWLVQPGDGVETGQVIALISVGGVEMEYRSTANGILSRQLVMTDQLVNTETLALISVNPTNLISAIVAAASWLNPGTSAAMAAMASSAFPQMASQIALAASIAAPGQAQQIALQIINAVPGLSQTDILTAALTGSGLSYGEISMTVELLMLGLKEKEQQVYNDANAAMSSGGANVGSSFGGVGAIDTPGNPGGLLNPFSEPTPVPTPAPTPVPVPTPTPVPTPIPFPTPPIPYSS